MNAAIVLAHFFPNCFQALFSAHDVLRDAGSVTSELSFQEMAHGLLGRVVSGKVECKEEGGVTQLCVKGKDGDDRIIEFKTVSGNLNIVNKRNKRNFFCFLIFCCVANN